MPSYAELLGLAEDDLRQRTVSLAAYALSLSDRTFDFPIRDVPPDQRARYPVSASEDELRVEAAMTMLGAAGASMVIDQQIGLALTSVAADWYWRAGHYFGAFLQAVLGAQGEGALAVASELAERPVLGAADRPATFFPEQLAYLAMGVAIGGNVGLANRLFNYVPEATAIGPFAVPVRLLQAYFSRELANEDSGREIAQFVIASFEISKMSLESQPQYRQFLPWNVGFPQEASLLIARFIMDNTLTPDQLVATNRYGAAFRDSAIAVAGILPQLSQSQESEIPDVLGPWLESG